MYQNSILFSWISFALHLTTQVMISDLQADIDQENEPDFSKFSCLVFVHIYQMQSKYSLKVIKPHHQLSDKVLLTDSTIGLPQTRRDKRQNARQRGRRGHNKDQRRQLSEKLLKGTTCHNFLPGWPWGTFGSTWYKDDLNSSSFRGLADAGDHRVGFESHV